MANINDNYLKLAGSYLFRETAHRTAAYKEAHPEADVISLGIGDVTLPLPDACIQAMHKAVDEMANASTFRGYGPEQGYSFLVEKIIENNYKEFSDLTNSMLNKDKDSIQKYQVLLQRFKKCMPARGVTKEEWEAFVPHLTDYQVSLIPYIIKAMSGKEPEHDETDK